MRTGHGKIREGGTARAALGALGVLGLLLCPLLLLAAPPAQATPYEQTGIFAGSLEPPKEAGVFPEEVQLGGVGGMAVNYTGAGGMAVGTLYAATHSFSAFRVAMFTPKPDGGLEFSGAWQVNSKEPPQHCGPEAPLPPCSPQSADTVIGLDVDVDQATGNVYVLRTTEVKAGDLAITEYSPDGSKVIARFGKSIGNGQNSTAETPEAIHDTSSGGIAVNKAGEVYVFDFNAWDNFYHRLMVFKPKNPNDYSEYEYTGDILAGFLNENPYPTNPVLDEAGDIYTATEEAVRKYNPAQPAKSICEFTFEKGGITSLAVNPESGEAFFFSYKKTPTKAIHQLSPCDEETGKFTETSKFEVKPERADLFGLTLDPLRKSPGHPAGVLYGGAPEAVPGVGKGQPGAGALGYIFAPAVENKPPVVDAESVSHVTSTTAELHAAIDRKGFETSYAFQYIDEAAYQANEPSDRFSGASEAPPGGAVLSGGGGSLPAGVVLTGLAPETAYHYRAVATSHCSPSDKEKVCEGVGADQTFTTFSAGAAGLPDKRAWELVSPVQKNGGQVLPAEPITSSCGLAECKPGAGYNHFPMQSAPDGDAVVYEGSPFSSDGAVIENEYISRRNASGWQTTNLTPPLLQSKSGQGYKAFDESLSEGILEQISPSLSPEAPSDYANLYRQPTEEPLSLEPLLKSEPPNRLAGEVANSFEITYADASADFNHQIFEANDALSAETAFAPEALDPEDPAKENNLYEWAGGELRLVNVAPDNAETTPGAVLGSGTLLKSGNSNTPSTVVDHAISDDGGRIFWTSKAGQLFVREDGETTVEIEDPGKFLTAAADGSKVLLSDGCLYDLQTKACTDLSAGEGGFLGITGQSEDLSHIYFVDTAVLTGEEENDQGQKAVAGKANLYAWDEGATAFVATLSSKDSSDWEAAPSVRTGEASPSGRWATFLSRARLTGYDNVGPCELEGSSGKYIDIPCTEVFLYDSAAQRLICASCNPSNERPLGGSVLRLDKDAQGFLSQPRYLTDSGRLYFDSRDSLAAADTNEGVEDVYQWEPNGIGTCKREAGCVSLISAGSEATDSNFLAMDETGKSVFFTSRDQLVLRDRDRLIDLYVAREDGGIPVETETEPATCQGEACQPPVSAPNDPTPRSSGFEGAGNVAEEKHPSRCPKGKVRRHGRCVAKKHRKRAGRHHRRANHNRGGAK